MVGALLVHDKIPLKVHLLQVCKKYKRTSRNVLQKIHGNGMGAQQFKGS